MRNLATRKDIWYGVLYVPPHFSASDLQGQLREFFAALPPTTLPCVVSGDVNSPLSWHSDEVTVQALGNDAKGRVLLDKLQASGFQAVPPHDDQLSQPTSRRTL